MMIPFIEVSPCPGENLRCIAAPVRFSDAKFALNCPSPKEHTIAGLRVPPLHVPILSLNFINPSRGYEDTGYNNNATQSRPSCVPSSTQWLRC